MHLATSLVALSLVGLSLATSQSQNALSACEPITETVTLMFCPSETTLASAIDSTTTASYSTITSFSTLTSYVTVPPSQTVVLPSSSGYSYIDHDGTTSWISGVSPTVSFSSTVTETVQMTVFPVATDDIQVTVTQTTVLTITPPAVTSIESQSSVALAGQSDEETTTSTVTSYRTKSVISVLTVYLSSRSSKPAALMTSSAAASAELTSHSTSTGPPTSAESVCSVSYVDITTDFTYTVIATPSAGFSSVINSVGNLSSYAPIASAWNITMHPSATLTGSLYKPSGFSGAVTTATASLVSSVSVGAASQTFATAISPVVPSSALRHGNNGSTVSPSATGYVPFMPVPVISLSAPAAFSRTSSTLSKKYTNTSISAMPTPTVCGEHGEFTLTWEDEPTFLPTEPITDSSDAPPVFNPYHHMYFSDGFVYAPPPSVPFEAASSPRLVMFVANETGDNDNHSEGGQLSGEIGAGTRRSSNAFWFNAHSAYLGCENHSAHQCVLKITGLVYQSETKSEVAAFHQTVKLLPCYLPDNCHLTQIDFSESMKGMSGLRIQASVNEEPVSWFMDNLALGWSNNTCAAGLLRARSR
ncbi:hypothetical protein D6C86_04630 [Aureobasidium pullulans]|uniref:DUF7371 domain-containing protein n=1 Tax=Aureobasidium pullulans TaxID=5580 RepID=A0A4S9YWM4_AURPU|nr:hypothetical protein D6C94_07488 [Aureobasidium pullulans]THZ43652.1 hypothetical protein D6C87_04158 [Aureobasidium pullulans]THZ61013.1 hypothetical protein D6C86_04630 [Aureobasidium pullulans]THZ96807.1 hypothetical protein D6C88_01461 [Aureobasidium pullulans]